MNKSKIKQKLIHDVKEEMEAIKEALGSSRSHVKDDDMKSEGKYDTRAIEAGYLADAQQKRIDELKLELQLLEGISIKKHNPGDDIGIGDLAEIEFNSQTRHYYLSPTAGGTMLLIDETPILVISTFSPIGDELIGLKRGDEFEVETRGEVRAYKILNVL